MLEGLLYLASSFWLGALHAATPGHGKTASAAYLVGLRGRPADALALGIFVTLSHTCGIVFFALLATLGSTLLSQPSELGAAPRPGGCRRHSSRPGGAGRPARGDRQWQASPGPVHGAGVQPG